MKGATIFVWNERRMLVRYYPDMRVADAADSDELNAMLVALNGRKTGFDDYWQVVAGQMPVNLGDVELKPMPQMRKAVLP